jgi:hypothetical protein
MSAATTKTFETDQVGTPPNAGTFAAPGQLRRR